MRQDEQAALKGSSRENGPQSSHWRVGWPSGREPPRAKREQQSDDRRLVHLTLFFGVLLPSSALALTISEAGGPAMTHFSTEGSR